MRLFSSYAYWANDYNASRLLGRFADSSIFETCGFAVDKKKCSFGFIFVYFLIKFTEQWYDNRNDDDARAAHGYLRKTLLMFSAELVPLTSHIPTLHIFCAVSRALTGLATFTHALIAWCRIFLHERGRELLFDMTEQEYIGLCQDIEHFRVSNCNSICASLLVHPELLIFKGCCTLTSSCFQCTQTTHPAFRQLVFDEQLFWCLPAYYGATSPC